MILRRFEDDIAAATALTHEIAGQLRTGIARRGAASLVLPGGSTPLQLFRQLRDKPLQWSLVGVTLTDERWVPESDAASNGGRLRAEFLGGQAGAAHFVPFYRDSPGAAASAPQVWRELQALARPFDTVVLGMGEDGHFASLFPGNPGLEAALDPDGEPGCVAMSAPVEPRERLSLNLAALVQSRRLFLLASGVAKRDLLLRAAQPGAAAPGPIAALLSLWQPPPEIFWWPAGAS